MKAAIYTRYGPPDVVTIQDVAKPVPGERDVLVKVRAATVCAADWRLRKADPFLARLFNGLWRPRKVRILGMEFAGTVESTGAAVTRFAAGDQVFGGTLFRFGTHAEYLCIPEDEFIAPRPMNTRLEDSAAFYFGGTTVLNFLNRAKIHPGQNVLVYGASGSVGVFAVQLAKHFGAHVTAVCSTSNLELVKSLGADQVVDYTREDFSAVGPSYDMIFDTVGQSGYWRSLRSLRRGGSYVLVAFLGRKTFMGNLLATALGSAWASVRRGIRVVSIPAPGTYADFMLLRELIEAGAIRTVIEKRYPLAKIAEAHRHAESGRKKGHVLVCCERDE